MMKTVLLFTILVSFGQVTCTTGELEVEFEKQDMSHVNEREKRNENELKVCGNKTYYKYNEFCCVDKLYSIKKYLPKCCGNQPHNFTTHICCRGTAYQRGAENSRCCGKQSYNPKTHLCCKGQLHLREPHRYPNCCWDKIYDLNTHFCCVGNYTIYPWGPIGVCCSKGKEVSYERSTQFCCGGDAHFKTDYPISGCCSKKPISYRDSMCCDGKIFSSRGPNNFNRCCGKVAYNSETTGCCYETIVKKYNDRDSTCCWGTEGGTLIPNPANNGNSTLRCCKNSYYGAYDTAKDICCGGSIWEKHIADACCAGRNGYNTKSHTCCQGRVFSKKYKLNC